MTARQKLPELRQRHSEHLQASAISIEVIHERGYRSVSQKSNRYSNANVIPVTVRRNKKEACVSTREI